MERGLGPRATRRFAAKGRKTERFWEGIPPRNPDHRGPRGLRVRSWPQGGQQGPEPRRPIVRNLYRNSGRQPPLAAAGLEEGEVPDDLLAAALAAEAWRAACRPRRPGYPGTARMAEVRSRGSQGVTNVTGPWRQQQGRGGLAWNGAWGPGPRQGFASASGLSQGPVTFVTPWNRRVAPRPGLWRGPRPHQPGLWIGSYPIQPGLGVRFLSVRRQEIRPLERLRTLLLA